MLKFLAMLTVASCALALLVSPASAATKSCSTSIMNTGNLKATNISCKRARTLMREHLRTGRKRLHGYTCTMKMYEGGTTHTCRNGDKKFKFQTAD